MASATCSNIQKVKFTVNPRTDPDSKDPNGRPAPLDGPLSGVVTSGDGTFELDPTDPKSYFVVSGDTGGGAITTVEVSADANMSPTEVRTLTEIVTLTVTDAEASALGSVASAPEPK